MSIRYSVVAPDGSGRRDLVLGTAVGPIYWSPNDRYISYDGRFDAEVVSVDALCCDAAEELAPAVSGPWAPRQMRVVIGLESGHLVTTNQAGTQRRRLTHGKEELRPVAWSRSGRWILFEGVRGESTRFDLYVVRVTTGLVRRLATDARLGSFSPDANRVAYSTRRGGVYTVSIDGRSRRRLTSDGVDPQWSPDGQWIAFESGRGIELIHPDGTRRHPLLRAPR